MDRQTALLFLNLFGGMRSASSLSQRDVTAFVRAREAGRLGTGQSVGPRTIEKNLRWLLAVLNWATLAGDGQGNYLLARNPLKGLPLPKEQNPNRPTITDERYKAMLSVAEQVNWRFVAALVIAHETGHYLGLFHTVEFAPTGGADTYDNITDTLDTPAAAQNNLMFGAVGTSTTLTPGQGFVMRNLAWIHQ